MSKVLIWDLPTRLFHWVLTVGFVVAFGIAQLAGEHSRWFPIHMILGIVLGFVVMLRIVWGLMGSRYARLNSLLYSPRQWLAYMRDAVSRTAPRYVGHNPGSAYATLAILALICVVAGSGLMMSFNIEAAEEIHVPAAYLLAAVVALHIAGVIWHSWRHQENLAATMVTGWKEAEPDNAIASNRLFAASVFAVLIAVMTVGLFRNYDRRRSETRLPIIGVTIHLGEDEEH